MKYKFGFFAVLGVIFFVANQAKAQYEDQAALFGQSLNGGSARIQGMGGAQISIGGDLSSIQSNPAGLGFYNRSEFSITPTLGVNSSNTNYFGNKTYADNSSGLDLGNVSIVFNNSRDNGGPWRGGSFGISYNQTNNFYNRFSYSGINPQNSIADFFAQQSNGWTEDQIRNGQADLIWAAYENYLINPVDGEDALWGRTGEIEGKSLQEETVTTRGSQSQWNFSYGGNYDDKIFFGAGIGITSINYRQDKSFDEYFDEGSLARNFLDESTIVNGTGINATLGVIVKPTDNLNIGVSLVTPTYYNMSDQYFATLGSDYLETNDADADSFTTDTDIFVSDYRYRTPAKVSGGLSYFIGKVGFITADIDYVDYSSMRYSSDDFSVSDYNQNIQDIFRPAVNIRLGGEARLNMFRLRAGFANYGTPYENSEILSDRQAYSLGGGIKVREKYVDLALVQSRYKSTYNPYFVEGNEVGDTPVASVKNVDTQLVLTFGWYF
ncbi:OmpP1/FadL family transporter [Xanthovirga aplysinae]|uniref:OmpP1/FadL family transporter n=1 Tax=Xanthovirga aplysinae TaxID=2529853 RepID=UPI0012BC10F1|nr:long-chain fatty acid transporter [Xanthovirga aplysinae]MTI32672.1 long-chain fatty acid transporter [Xanthovirga aplysinae]